MYFIASIYYPLGLLNPFIVSIKILLQDICPSNISWDTVIPVNLLKRWLKILEDIPDSQPFIIPRICAFYNINDPFITQIQFYGRIEASLCSLLLFTICNPIPCRKNSVNFC